MTIPSEHTRHPGFLQSDQLNALRRGDNRAPNFRVELRALKPAYGLVCAITVRLFGGKADIKIPDLCHVRL